MSGLTRGSEFCSALFFMGAVCSQVLCTAAMAQIPPMQARLTVDSWTKAGPHRLQPGEVLRTGDWIALNIEHERPAYIYVLNWTSEKKIQFLHPSVELLATAVQRAPGRSRIPEDEGYRIKLDTQTGMENLYVVVHASPLSREELESFLRNEMGTKVDPQVPPRRAKAPQAPRRGLPEPPPPAPFLGQATRGFTVEQVAPTALEKKGARILRLSIPHQ